MLNSSHGYGVGYTGANQGIGVVKMTAHVRRVFSGEGAGLYQVDVMDHTMKRGGNAYWFLEPAMGVMDDLGNLVKVES